MSSTHSFIHIYLLHFFSLIELQKPCFFYFQHLPPSMKPTKFNAIQLILTTQKRYMKQIWGSLLNEKSIESRCLAHPPITTLFLVAQHSIVLSLKNKQMISATEFWPCFRSSTNKHFQHKITKCGCTTPQVKNSEKRIVCLTNWNKFDAILAFLNTCKTILTCTHCVICVNSLISRAISVAVTYGPNTHTHTRIQE